MALRFELITLQGTKFDQEVYEVILPTSTGHIAVFEQHMPLVTVAVAGVMTVVHKAGDPQDKHDHFVAEGGIIEIGAHSVRVLVDQASHADEIVEEEAKRALERAYQLKDEAKDTVSIEQAQAVVDRESVRLKVAEIRRRHRTK